MGSNPLRAHEIVPALIRFGQTLFNAVRHPRDPVIDVLALGRSGFVIYPLAASASGVLGILGMYVYFLMGGRHYYNVWFLFLMPLITFSVSLTMLGLLRIFPETTRKQNADRSLFFHNCGAVIVAILPLAWTAAPLRLAFPSAQNLIVFAMFALLVLASVRVLIAARKYARPWTVAPWVLVPGLSVILFTGAAARIAERTVQLLRL